MSEIRLSKIIAPCFFDVHKAVRDNAYTHYWLKGGRASTKSSYVSLEIIQGMMRDNDANAIIYRQIGNTLADSVVSQCNWAIHTLGVQNYWKIIKSPYQLIYKPTGQRILFKGNDNAEKSKGIKLANGYFKYVWFEELSEFSCIDEVETVIRSVVRGKGKSSIFYTYNPPRSQNNWVNAECLIFKPNRMVHHSTYLDVQKEWLGEQFIEDAETTKKVNEIKYNWAYMGEVTGTGGAVFENVVIRIITDDELKEFDRIYHGVDWGYYPDPFAYLKMYYNATQRKLYIFDEYIANKQSNRATADTLINDKGITSGDLIIADSAEPKSIADYRSYGLFCRGVKKGAGSVEYTMKWLQSLSEIVIDNKRCPKSAVEFLQYEYARAKDGEIIDGYPDVDNHCIDAARYGMYPMWKIKGE